MSNLSGCQTCIKYSLFVFNFFFWLIGCACVGVGIWILVDAQKFLQFYAKAPSTITSTVPLDENSVKILGIIAIAVGALVLLLGFLGCCGAIRESPCMLVTFFILMTLILLILIACGIAVFVIGNTFTTDVIYKELNAEATSNVTDGLLYFANQKYGCCGVNSTTTAGFCPTAYAPANVCNTNSTACQYGCLGPLTNSLSQMKLGLGIALLVSGSVIIFGLIFSMALCCAIRESLTCDEMSPTYSYKGIKPDPIVNEKSLVFYAKPASIESKSTCSHFS